MAATALDVVSVARAKYELKIPASEDSEDTQLTGHIEAAVNFVSETISRPIVDDTDTLDAPRRAANHSIFLQARVIKSVTAVRYWTRAAELRDMPNASIAPADLGRQKKHRKDWGLWVWPPVDGWPDVLFGSCFEFEVQRGIDIDDKTEALAQAVVMCVRQLYDGYLTISPDSSFFILLQPWIRYGII